MSVLSAEALNEVAMKVIMHAGEARKYCNDAINALCEDEQELYQKWMEVARQEIILAHNLQTETIQATIECTDQAVTLLFIHAQDTLMTINSEINLAGHLYKLYQKLSDKA